MLALPAPGPASFPARRTLTPIDRRVLGAIAEAMFSQDGELTAARITAHLDEVDAIISAASGPLRAGLRLALFAVRIAPLLSFFRFRLLENLSVDDRVALLGRLERSRLVNLSLAFIGWRAILTLVVYEHPTELRSLGYTTDDRRRHLRTLPVAEAPIPLESGVRLTGGADSASHEIDSERVLPAARDVA